MKQISITFFSGSSLQYRCLDTWNLFQVSALGLSELLHLSSKQRSTWQEAAIWQLASLNTQSFVQLVLQLQFHNKSLLLTFNQYSLNSLDLQYIYFNAEVSDISIESKLF